ncbi:preprotein translocase subunit YidC [Kwoniella heveanensis CBS 569]|uniref:Preprotein translocase subunit YidC n=1 Tax=Kwoniella heveanensis BCC8398 TaxID=1296120 RepID=A0A1B9GW12_9TREE|nr:preprotein translocase subunit YidC [Kwoniella heveanensis BCC8398]OCF43824.1 preprotein translocase subunit YidC [Kwoniella heveanensis CBS 569]
MLPRSALRRVARPTSSFTGQSQNLSVRHLSHVARLSPIALGKRPAVPVSAAAYTSSLGASRNISWTPWRTSTPSPTTPVEEPVASASAALAESFSAAPSPESILSEPHPDLQAAAPAAAPSQAAEGALAAPPVDSIASASASLPPADPSYFPQPPASPLSPTLEDLLLNSGKSLDEVLNSQEAIHAAMKVSDLKLMGMEHGFFSISGWFTDAIVALHTTTGLPWWATIASITVAIRFALSPILISTQKHNVRLAAVNPQIQAFMERAKEAQAKQDVHAQTVVGQAMRQLMKDHNVNPLRALLLPAIQLPVFFTFFTVVRGLANLPLPQLKEGGFGWVTDLTVADPYYILPLTSLVFTNLVFKYGADGMNTDAKTGSPMRAAHMRNFIQVTTLASLPIVSYFPAALLFYWTFSSGFTLLQSLILRQPAVKALLGIPAPPVVVPPPGQQPFKDPSIMDTWRAGKEWYFERMEAAQKMQESKMAQSRMSERNASVIAQHRPEQFVERIKEEGVPTASATSAAVEATAAPASQLKQQQSTQASAGAGVRSAGGRQLSAREAEKQRRIAAAREKRARQ